MTLYTDRLILRPWTEEDAKSLYEYAKDPDVGPIAGWPVHTSVENSREIIRNVLAVPENYAVCLKGDSTAIGSIGLMVGNSSNLNLTDKEGEIGYWLGKPFWGRELVPEGVRELIRHAFADLRLETLWCGWFDGNEKSRRCQEKCGFRYVRTEKDIYWKLMDDIRTEHISRLTRAEWTDSFEIRPLREEEIAAALDLAWSVFLEYESPVYTPEGTEEFRSCLHDDTYLAGIAYYGAFCGDRLIGMLGIRKENAHICFVFTDGKYHRLGIASKIFGRMDEDFRGRTVTVNSSPYGLPFYRAIGYRETSPEQTVNGIRFTPMEALIP